MLTTASRQPLARLSNHRMCCGKDLINAGKFTAAENESSYALSARLDLRQAGTWRPGETCIVLRGLVGGCQLQHSEQGPGRFPACSLYLLPVESRVLGTHNAR